MEACMLCGAAIADLRTRTDARPVCAACIRSVEPVEHWEQMQSLKALRAVPLPVRDEDEGVDECAEIDTRRFRNMGQGGV